MAAIPVPNYGVHCRGQNDRLTYKGRPGRNWSRGESGRSIASAQYTPSAQSLSLATNCPIVGHIGNSRRGRTVSAVSFFRAFPSILVIMFAASLASNGLADGDELGSNNLDPIAIEKVDRLFEKWDKPNTPGAVLAILRDGKIIYSRGYGMANLEEAVPNTSATVFHLGSVSKQFTAFAIQLLANDGKLSLDDDFRKYIPEAPEFEEPITIRLLLHHTSGLRDQWNLLALAGWRLSDVITNGDVRRILMQQKELNFTPGSEMLYSNSGYSVLAEVVRRVSGMPLGQLAKERIFTPLEMNDTRFQAHYGNIIKDRAYSYAPTGNGAYRYVALSYSTYGPSSVFSTVGDLARWDENFYTAKVGGPSVVRAMQEKGKLNDGKELDYASGLVIGEYRGAKTVSHSGADAGYRANIVRFADYHFTVIVLANAGNLDGWHPAEDRRHLPRRQARACGGRSGCVPANRQN